MDLTPRISPFLDRHLVFPLLEFLQDRQIYAEDEVLKAKIDLLAKTNMVDYAMDIHKSLYNTEEVPDAMIERRAEVVERLKSLEEAALPLIEFLQNPSMVQELRQDKQYNLHILQEKYKIGEEQIEVLYQYAKFQFECGNYSGASDFLYQYRTLCTNADRSLSALWGKLAAEILMQRWDVALEEMNKLKEAIESKSFTSQLVLLQQRTWLLHWSLFIFFNTENGRNAIIDLFFQEKYMNAIQCNAPHLLRYLTAAVVTNKRRRNMVKDLVKVIQQEGYNYSDCLTSFVEKLYVDYDFEAARQKLVECEQVLSNDFFLGQQVNESEKTSFPFKSEFMENARLFLFENYCQIHQCIELSALAEKLDMSKDDAERWIIDLIRNAKLDAKIDSNAGTIIMTAQRPSVYESLIEKTKSLTARSYQLTTNVLSIGAPVPSAQ